MSLLSRPTLALLAALLASSAAAFEAPRGGADDATLTPLERLGQRIFEDRTLSRPEGVSCASCHDA